MAKQNKHPVLYARLCLEVLEHRQLLNAGGSWLNPPENVVLPVEVAVSSPLPAEPLLQVVTTATTVLEGMDSQYHPEAPLPASAGSEDAAPKPEPGTTPSDSEKKETKHPDEEVKTDFRKSAEPEKRTDLDKPDRNETVTREDDSEGAAPPREHGGKSRHRSEDDPESVDLPGSTPDSAPPSNGDEHGSGWEDQQTPNVGEVETSVLQETWDPDAEPERGSQPGAVGTTAGTESVQTFESGLSQNTQVVGLPGSLPGKANEESTDSGTIARPAAGSAAVFRDPRSPDREAATAAEIAQAAVTNSFVGGVNVPASPGEKADGTSGRIQEVVPRSTVNLEGLAGFAPQLADPLDGLSRGDLLNVAAQLQQYIDQVDQSVQELTGILFDNPIHIPVIVTAVLLIGIALELARHQLQRPMSPAWPETPSGS